MKRYLTLIKVLISVGVLFLLFHRVDYALLWEHLLKIEMTIFAIAISILFFQCALSSYKWKIILSSESKEIPYWYLLKSYLICNFISLFLPSSFGGDLYRIYSLKKFNKDYLQNTSSVLFDRLTGLFALLSISILSFAMFSGNVVNIRILALYVIGILTFWAMTTKWVLHYLERSKFKLMEYLLGVLKSFRQYRNSKKILISCLIFSFIFQSNIVILNKIYTVALSMDVDIKYLFTVIPLIYLTEALPISINGLGVREGAFVFFMKQIGYTNEQGLAMGILVIGMRYIFTILLGGSLFFLMVLKAKAFSKTRENQT
jgi:uncharacterized protein (TIRG00374 family)